ncbi:ceramidase domain-containing protein [Spirosoma rhododendri]|uniref:Ceramidase n=1 Tax=Spirosoma rhododendri TaxID=2728024 RepID=A0A7L5DL23_9BACT|nr:ceramidase domain-containing protein [Spirosoma rhododendri]QJD78785.1 ceramidase [Spirosoma rhododendri]
MTRSTVLPLLFRALLLTLGMGVVWGLLDWWLSGTIWQPMEISRSAKIVEYCEFNHIHRFFHQPSNTYSNLAYVFFGAFILLLANADSSRSGNARLNRLERFPALSVLVGGCFVYLGVGSAFFHASLTTIGQRVDMNATYGLMLSLISVAVYHIFHTVRLNPRRQLIWVLIVLVVIAYFWLLAPRLPSSRLLPALIVALTLGMLINYVQFRRQRSLWLVLASVALTFIAIKIRTMDVQKINCDPYSILQGHAIWHLLTGLSSFCAYLFFRLTSINIESRRTRSTGLVQ